MSDRITRWLDESQRLADQATEGPWGADRYSVFTYLGPGDCSGCSGILSPAHLPECGLHEVAEAGKPDAEFIAGSRTRLPQAVAALRAVLDLHRRAVDFYEPVDFCAECSSFHRTVEWPCPTLRAITDALGLEGDNDEHLG